jgi:hypothetical protein
LRRSELQVELLLVQTLAEAPFPSAPNQSLGDPIFFFPRKSIRAIVLYLSSLTRFSSC